MVNDKKKETSKKTLESLKSQQGHNPFLENRHEPLLMHLSRIVSCVSHSQMLLTLFRGDSRLILDRGHLNTHTQTPCEKHMFHICSTRKLQTCEYLRHVPKVVMWSLTPLKTPK